MHAVLVNDFGGPEVLRPVELPDPEPGPGELLVRVAAADTLHVETQIRSGRAREWFATRPPYVPGGGGSGTVVAAGDGADTGWVGRDVVVTTGQEGGYAELAVAPEAGVVPLPDGVGLEAGAALLHDGATAMGLLDGTPVHAGDRVLVLAAGGGLGVLLVQLATAAGAQVVAAARGARKLDLARELGAVAAVDYSRPGWEDAVREATAGKGADVVFDGAGGDLGRAAFGLTAPGGRMSLHGAAGGGFAPVDREAAAERGVTVRGIEQVRHVDEDPATMMSLVGRALAEVAAGHARPVVGRTFPLSQAAEAHRAIEERRALGKTLLLP
jgi:NADPH2:quinone reductase